MQNILKRLRQKELDKKLNVENFVENIDDKKLNKYFVKRK